MSTKAFAVKAMNRRLEKNQHTQSFQRFERQQGWTFWSLFFVLAVIMFFSYCVFQLVPIYSANENVINAMELSIEEADLRRVTRNQIIRKIDNQLYLDGSHELIDYKEEIVIKRDKSKLTLQAVYNREVPLFFNLAIKVAFEPVVECDLDGQCKTVNKIF